MKREAIKIEYPGSCISVNHYLSKGRGGRVFVKPEAKAWQKEFQWLLKHLHLENWKLPLEIKCDGYFKDARSACDLSNLSKVILDAIEELIGVNDKYFRWHDGNRDIGFKEPHLIITLSEPQELSIKPLASSSTGTTPLVNDNHHKTKRKGLK